MKTRKDSYPKNSDGAAITFCDVVAHFSEEEWKLLHHWQKELYKNVMKEIHQVLISLGPLIATSVFSLRPNKKDGMCSTDPPDIEIKGTINSPSRATCDVLLFENQCLNSTPDQIEKEICDDPSAAPEDSESFVTFTVKGEEEFHVIDECIYDERENLSIPIVSQAATAVSECHNIEQFNPSSVRIEDQKHSDSAATIKHNYGFPVHNNKADANLEDGYCAVKEGSYMSLYSGDDVTTSLESIGINDQGEVYPIDVQACQRREHFRSPPGNESTKRKRNMDNSINMNYKTRLGKSTSKEPNANLAVLERKKSINQKYSESDQELRHNEINSNVNEKLLKPERLETYSTSEKILRKQNNIPCELNPLRSLRQHPFPKNEQTSQKSNYAGHLKAHRVKRKYPCTHCGKSFNASSNLLTHERIHTGERPFQCVICGKSFNQTGVLYRHQKMHTGERPYQCNICGKRFNLKHHLLGHQKVHSKE